MEAKVFDTAGKETGKKTLNPKIFGVEVKQELLKQAVLRYLASFRETIAKTKTRSDRRGGGKKPWRQKGTGRARAGTRRSPIWRKGGVVFGPTGNENFTKNLPKKALRKAILMSLSQKAKDDRIVILKDLTIEKPQTKKAREILDKLPVEKRILIISEKDPILFKSFSNLPSVLTIFAGQLNAYDVLVSDYMVILESALLRIEKSYLESKSEVKEISKEEKVKEKEVKKESKESKNSNPALKKLSTGLRSRQSNNIARPSKDKK